MIYLNWYKTALKEKEFYGFYGYLALPNKIFEENPIAFFSFIEILNSIRDYYLPYLIRAIQGELKYAYIEDSFGHNDGFENICNNYDNGFGDFPEYYELIEDNRLSFEDFMEQKWIGEEYWRNHADNIEDTTDKDAQWAYEEYNNEEGYIIYILRPEYLKIINRICNKDITSFTPNDFKQTAELFTELPWDGDYGGELWAVITDWTLELHKIGSIEQAPYSFARIKKAQKLAMIIDTIHSLEHNTASVLRDLPNGEHKWLERGLDYVAYVTEPSEVAKESGNRDLIKLYHQYR